MFTVKHAMAGLSFIKISLLKSYSIESKKIEIY